MDINMDINMDIIIINIIIVDVFVGCSSTPKRGDAWQVR
jgi:hypothetical protein